MTEPPTTENVTEAPLDQFLIDILRSESERADGGAAQTLGVDVNEETLLSRLLGLAQEDAVIEDVLLEVDFLLSETDPLSASQRLRLIQGADHGVQLAANRYLEPEPTIAELDAVLRTLRDEHVSGEPLDSFARLVTQLMSESPVSFDDYDAPTVARWVTDLSVPPGAVLGLLAPRQRDASRDLETSSLLAVGSNESEWTDFAHDVMALVDAHKTRPSAAGEEGTEPRVDERDQER